MTSIAIGDDLYCYRWWPLLLGDHTFVDRVLFLLVKTLNGISQLVALGDGGGFFIEPFKDPLFPGKKWYIKFNDMSKLQVWYPLNWNYNIESLDNKSSVQYLDHSKEQFEDT